MFLFLICRSAEVTFLPVLSQFPRFLTHSFEMPQLNNDWAFHVTLDHIFKNIGFLQLKCLINRFLLKCVNFA